MVKVNKKKKKRETNWGDGGETGCQHIEPIDQANLHRVGLSIYGLSGFSRR